MNLDWWKRAVVYQIYPRSFQDSNGDGDGDLRGIERRLDYLQWLGIDTVWVSVIYQSPHVDGGYDVSDYERIDPRYGTMEDAEALIAEVHRRGMRVLFGLVPNHTSDQHPWFRASRANDRNPHADWYHWQDARPRGIPPNNWLDALGNSAWSWCEERRQFYYHAYFPQQPDLNWRNPQVREAIHRIMRFWLDRGVDGFRIDVLWRLAKDRLMRNDPPNTSYNRDSDPPWKRLDGAFSGNQPEVHEVIRGMRAVADEYGDRILVGEVYVPLEDLMTYYGETQLPFNFLLIFRRWTAPQLMEAISRYFAELPPDAWANWVLGNHDQSRVATREGEDGARIGAVLQFTLGGTPFVYNGEEIGMHDVPMAPEQMHDPMKRAGPRYARDRARTPMQWSSGHAAGFTTREPWLPLAGDFRERNVDRQREDPRSMLHLYRDLIALRRREEAILAGHFIPLEQRGNLVAYVRSHGSSRYLVVANFGHDAARLETDELELRGAIAIATDRSRDGEAIDGLLNVAPREAIVVRLE